MGFRGFTFRMRLSRGCSTSRKAFRLGLVARLAVLVDDVDEESEEDEAAALPLHEREVKASRRDDALARRRAVTRPAAVEGGGGVRGKGLAVGVARLPGAPSTAGP